MYVHRGPTSGTPPSLHFVPIMSFLSHLNPAPSFPSYTGPYAVGTTDVEIPAAELPSPSSTPVPALSTVSFRIFYPCEVPPKPAKPVYWLPDPQHDYLGAYVRFLGASRRLSAFLRSGVSMVWHIMVIGC